ncbi:MAG: phosphoribosylaminoimidazolesuccinocarboxamide synthase [Deltaproteobacteria bacterium]|nr:phosphoribosylaminoimidazolesuccinocarboxamide synthase [Deltaproteobacteria bacterium]
MTPKRFSTPVDQLVKAAEVSHFTEGFAMPASVVSVANSDSRLKVLTAALQAPLENVLGMEPDYRGKVRDVFFKKESSSSSAQELFLVATDRVSAFDRILGTIPLKGSLLTEQSAFWLEKASSIAPTHFLERIAPQVMRCKKATPLPIELIVRGYLAGSLMRTPAAERGKEYGLELPQDLQNHQRFETPIVTPTTKADVGHDEPISLMAIPAAMGVKQKHLDAAVEYARALFSAGGAFAEKNGLILVDTKYEFGLIDDEVVLIDEVHTADSSRFWRANTYVERLAENKAPDMLDKERLRGWLLEQGFSGDGEAPAIPDDVKLDLADHYWQLTEQITGQPFTVDVAQLGEVETLLRTALSHAK